MNDSALLLHAVTVFPIMIFKLSVLIIGYLIARLGYNLLVKGISGDFKFKADLKGYKADVVSASPGIFFILMATILMSVGIIKDKPFKTEFKINNKGGDTKNSKQPSLPEIENNRSQIDMKQPSRETHQEIPNDKTTSTGGEQ